MSDAVAALRRVELLAMLDEDALAGLAARAHNAHYATGERLFAELEPGADVYVIVAGEVEVSVEPLRGARQIIGRLGPGASVGEMASVTGELRAATVTALGPVDALVIADADFDRLRARRPEVAAAMVRRLAARLADAEHAVAALLVPDAPPGDAAQPAARGSLRRAWRELVVAHRRDLAFLALIAFVATLALVRLGVHLAFRFDVSPRLVLRAAYLGGFLLLALSSLAALLGFRPWLRRAVALAYGVGAALILNELGVTLAFDIFYKDTETRDPALLFDVERLYRRTEAVRGVLVGLAVLIQAAYLGSFYRRAWRLVRVRLGRLTSRRR